MAGLVGVSVETLLLGLPIKDEALAIAQPAPQGGPLPCERNLIAPFSGNEKKEHEAYGTPS